MSVAWHGRHLGTANVRKLSVEPSLSRANVNLTRSPEGCSPSAAGAALEDRPGHHDPLKTDVKVSPCILTNNFFNRLSTRQWNLRIMLGVKT